MPNISFEEYSRLKEAGLSNDDLNKLKIIKARSTEKVMAKHKYYRYDEHPATSPWEATAEPPVAPWDDDHQRYSFSAPSIGAILSSSPSWDGVNPCVELHAPTKHAHLPGVKELADRLGDSSKERQHLFEEAATRASRANGLAKSKSEELEAIDQGYKAALKTSMEAVLKLKDQEKEAERAYIRAKEQAIAWEQDMAKAQAAYKSKRKPKLDTPKPKVWGTWE